MRISSLSVTSLALVQGVYAAFGLTSTSSRFKVDTAAGLVFEVNRANGDITSLKYNGVEYQGTGKATAINSGLGTSTVTGETINGYVKITVKAGSLPLTHYFVAKEKDAIIYMGTYITGEIDPGELRWLARLKTSELPTGVHGNVGDTHGCEAFEGKDTFKCTNGETRCKMYTSDRFIDDVMHGVSGTKASVWMIMPGVAYETSASGPFMRDINSQTGSSDQELYWYMNSGHVRTEPWRFGLQGPYAMAFTAPNEKPSENLDTSFFSELSIQGYVAANGRGSIGGRVTGVPAKFETVIHWHNTVAQYWTKAAIDGTYKSPPMKPGTYSTKVYKQELLVANSSVTVTSGVSTVQDIASKEPNPAVIWRIGEFDGQPFELKNGDKITRMHPSDVRMGSWGGTFSVGQSQAKDFPMALWSKQGGTATVTFTLIQAQVKAHLLRIGTTLSFKGGRPSVKIGSWTGSDPGAPKLIDSRGLTRGAYRGWGDVYVWNVPATAFKEGANTLTVGVYGSGDASWLSANYIIDALELQD
ncbi:Rhamnogalacturonase B, N-terminal-domain-containing protein [Dendryphion nanum]|uniref:rhamnogalacturonan endolyase n=1 Tax=Dendryphion nanum TaxID=256645 RepID=A0A9P9E057_9PLEO|nr:Rhamnogalacturonase B, N-terminal-domain-containing protein [Dendryphion nanum]